MSRPISRRAVLRGGGIALALPFLESLLPTSARAAAPQKRLIFFFVPNGIHMPGWTPKEVGAAYNLTPILQPLAPYKSELLVVSGLNNLPARPSGAGDHAGGTSAFLTCTRANKSDTDLRLGISVDQVAAQKLGEGARFPSLQLGLEGGLGSGSCDSGYSCAYTRSISWAGPKTPLPKMVDPQLVFDVLFRGEGAGQTPEQLERRRKNRLSVLDYVRGEAARLRPRLGATDRQKLEEYTTSVREVELRVQGMTPVCGGATRPKSADELPLRDYIKVMLDLLVLSLSCDLTRVVSLMFANGQSNRSYPFLGVTGAHHELSHHQNNPDTQALLQLIDLFEIEQLAYLVGKLKATTDGAGSLLDHTLIYFSSEIADGNSHAHTDLPTLLLGRLGGAVRPGRHLRYEGLPMANLFVSILNAVGMPTTRFGDDSTGPLTGLD